MTGLDKLRTCMTGHLARAGVNAVTAWGKENKSRLTEAAVAVSLRGCEGSPGGFQDYLGERYNAASGRWEELYGRRAKLTFGLDIYAAGRSGAEQCQRTFDALADALQQAPAGLSLTGLIRGECRYDTELGLFHCPVEARCDGYLYAVTDEEGSFLDFEVRGGGQV